jgi:hypothetical protein
LSPPLCEANSENISYFKSIRPPQNPPTFSVNFESREKTKKTYALIFEPRLGHPVAFNYDSDILFLTNYNVTWYFRSPAYQKFETDHRAPILSPALNTIREPITLNHDSGQVEFSHLDIQDIMQIIKWFPSVQDLFIIPNDEVKAAKGRHMKDLRQVEDPKDMKLAEECLERMTHAKMRKKRRECCILHKANCQCTFWTLPKIHFMTVSKMKKYLGADIVNINDPHFGEVQAGEEDDDLSFS